jgi:hypothetical protein
MIRTITSGLIGAVIGGILFFPPTIPTSFSIIFILAEGGMDLPTQTQLQRLELVYWVLPLTGAILGALIGVVIGYYRVYLILARYWTLTIIVGSILLFWLIGLEIGFIGSPVTMIGLGNTSTWVDLWVFSGMISGVGLILGLVVAFFLFAFISIIRVIRHSDHNEGEAQVKNYND